MYTEKNKISDAYLNAIKKATELNSSVIFSYSESIKSIDINSLINYKGNNQETKIYWKQKSKK